MGISAIQNELNKPDLAIGTSEVNFWLGGNRKYNVIYNVETDMFRALGMQSTSFKSTDFTEEQEKWHSG